jgi:uncharacterized protein (TIGR02231 family)
MSPSLNTQITAVTVYTDQALITRRGSLSLGGSETALRLTGLPATLQPDSVRVRGSGTVAVRLLGVSADRTFSSQPNPGIGADLKAQIEGLEDQLQDLQDRLETLKLQRNFVSGLGEKVPDRIARGLAQQQMSVAATGDWVDFLGNRYGDFAAQISQQERAKKQLEKAIKALRSQLHLAQAPQDQEQYQLTVPIAPAGPGEFELEVTYVCHSAGWQPLYDMRVVPPTLNLTYLAQVQQTTGEDWPAGAELTCSTAKPGLGTLPPQLDPWYLGLQVPQAAPPMLRARAGGSDDDAAQSWLDQEMDRSPAPMAMMFEVPAGPPPADVSHDGGVVTFRVGGIYPIPSDGSPHKVTLYEAPYPCRLEYAAMPKRVSFAYLQAVVTNPLQGVTLLPGPVNVFRGETFVGGTPIGNIAPGQEFTLNLGIDEGIQIERELVKREVDKRLISISNLRRLTYGYRVTVTNLQLVEARVVVSEQVPIGTHEQLKVKLSSTSPNINLGELGVLAWNLVLKPQAKQVLQYEFTVEHPPHLPVTGLEG